MKVFCEPLPINKKEYIADIGKILVNDYGKKKFCKPEEVKKTHQKSKWYDGLDFSCWGTSAYSSHQEYDRYHFETGEICNYTEMKSTILEGISMDSNFNLTELSDLDLDASWLDLGSIFDGLGEFFSAIDV